jgi:hypothetical protein
MSPGLKKNDISSLSFSVDAFHWSSATLNWRRWKQGLFGNQVNIFVPLLQAAGVVYQKQTKKPLKPPSATAIRLSNREKRETIPNVRGQTGSVCIFFSFLLSSNVNLT